MLKEFTGLMDRGTFEYKEHSDEKLVPLMWVFTNKFDEDGFLINFKARLVARGDLYKSDEETYAATLAAQTFRAIAALIAAFDLETRQYDAIMAFVNAKFKDPIPVQCPAGFTKPGFYLLALRALYGFPFSPLLWNDEIKGTLVKLGLYPIPGVNCVYSNKFLTVIFYVDDFVLVYPKKYRNYANEFERNLMAKYNIRKLGELEHFLGIRVIRDRPNRKLWLLQDSYIEKLEKKFNIHITKVPKTPIPANLIPNSGIATPEQVYAYQQRTGSINFSATHCRPDIARAISKLCEFQLNPSEQHIQAIEQALHYLVGTKYLALEFDGTIIEDQIFLTYSDAAFADDQNTRYSSNGYAIKLFGGMIHFKATKQKTVTTASTEAELLALTLTAKEYMWWIRFFKALGFELNAKTTIVCDNLQTIRLLTKEAPKLITRLKHVDIHQCWLRQEVQAERIAIKWAPTAQMVADGFTKELSPIKHSEFIKQLNMVDVEHMLKGVHQ